MLPDKVWKYVLLPLCCMVTGSFTLHAEATTTLWQKGNAFFAQKQYDSALYYYRQIEKQGYQNAALYYNIGNVYYRLGSTAPAVLYYEKALFKDPLNQQIKDNLTLAEARVALPIAPSEPVFFIAWWNYFVLLIAPSAWAWLMFLSFLCVLWLLYKKVREKEGLNFMGRWISLALAGLVVSGIFFYASYQARTHTGKAVVMVDNTPFFNAPDENQTGGQLPEGSVVSIQAEKEGWYAVTLPNGSQAWVSARNLDRVEE